MKWLKYWLGVMWTGFWVALGMLVFLGSTYLLLWGAMSPELTASTPGSDSFTIAWSKSGASQPISREGE